MLLDEEGCITCAEGWGEPNECPGSLRPCGHHCNHLDVHDACCWCTAHVNDDGEVVP